MTGINLMPAVPNTVITAKAAAKPALNKKSATFTAGQTFQLKMKNNKKAVKWTSRNKKVASVSSNGVLTAKKTGTAVITAAAADGSKKKASRKITIVEKQVPSAGNVSAIPVRPTEEAAIEIHSTEIRKLAPNADESVLHAFEYLGFEVEKNSYGQYSGYFTVKERKIY